MVGKIFLALALSGALVTQAGAQVEKDALVGVWKITAGIAYLPDGTTRSSKLQENLIIFTEKHYSMGWAGGGEVHPPFETPLRPTDEERILRFNRILVNAGAYEIQEDKLIIHPLFALVPEYVGGYGEFVIGEENGALTLNWIKILSVDGEPDPLSALGIHWKYFLAPLED